MASIEVPGNSEPSKLDLRAAQLAAQRAQEAQQVAETWETWEETDVAVVVFVRSRGVDHGDAQDRAKAAVATGLQQASDFDGRLEVRQRGMPVPGAAVQVVRVAELGSAAASGYIRVAPSTRAFR